jgi:drug/metabolite transporter (DMT)-like permease
MVFYYLFAVRAFQLAPVSDVVLIVGLSPLIGLGVKAFAGKPVTAIESIGAVTAFSGLILFVLPKLQGHHSDLSAYLMGLSFALFSAAILLSYVSLFNDSTPAKSGASGIPHFGDRVSHHHTHDALDNTALELTVSANNDCYCYSIRNWIDRHSNRLL